MMKTTKFLILCTLSSSGLIACSGEPTDLSSSDDLNETLAQDPDLLRFDIEIVGQGDVVVLEPYVETCTTDDGICSFVFERGTRLVFEGSDHEPIDLCGGQAICSIQLDQSLTFVADFGSQDGRIAGERPFGFLPGAPWIIIDPFTGGAEGERRAATERPQSAIEE